MRKVYTEQYRTDRIKKIIEKASLRNLNFNVNISNFTSLKVGGIGLCLAVADNMSELKEILGTCLENKIQFAIIGDGTNILVNDGYLNLVFIRLGKDFDYLNVTGDNKILVGAAYKLPGFVMKACHWGYDFSFLGGIPGTVGGAVIGNSGDSKVGICNFVKKLRGVFLEGNSLKEKVIDITDKDFGYRFLNIPDMLVVTDIFLRTEILDKKLVSAKIKNRIKDKKMKQPINAESAGCFFKNPSDLSQSAGELIEKSGLKGFIYGGARISVKHANFIENYKNATAEDILSLSKIAKATVYEKFNIKLEYEVKIIGF